MKNKSTTFESQGNNFLLALLKCFLTQAHFTLSLPLILLGCECYCSQTYIQKEGGKKKEGKAVTLDGGWLSVGHVPKSTAQ